MGSFILKGILIGLLFGMPAGAVGAMTAQRTLNYGMKAGLLTGLGSSVADCLYACIGAFGLTLISDFLLRYQNIINLAGGFLILGMGIRMFQIKTAGRKTHRTGLEAFGCLSPPLPWESQIRPPFLCFCLPFPGLASRVRPA